MANSQTVMSMIRLAIPPFRNNHDKVAFAIHASFIASGYILTATGRPAFADDALSSSSQNDVGIDGWNEFDGEYAFVYANPKKGSKKILVKCLAIDDKLLVDAIADGGAEPAHLEIKVENYAQESNEGDYAAQFKNLDKLLSDLQTEIVDKLDGKLKPVSSRTQSSSETNEEPRHYVDMPDPSGRPQIHPSGVVVPPIPGNGGYSDLFPGPGAGMYPGRGGFGDGSMLVGPSDPRFFPFGDGLIDLASWDHHNRVCHLLVLVMILMARPVFLVLSQAGSQGNLQEGREAGIQISSIFPAVQILYSKVKPSSKKNRESICTT